jgi:NADH/NAD ratio-sensing transcriptional regulator Rex
MGNKVSSGVKNHFAVKSRNKKLVENSKMLLLLIDVNRGYGKNLDTFARKAGVSPKRARRKIKMFNSTGQLCKGANYTVKQLKQKAFNR